MESKVKDVLLGEYLTGEKARHMGRVMREMNGIQNINTCQYCGRSAEHNKQGYWAPACRGCKISLTKMLRSGKYGETYNPDTKRRLLKAKYNWRLNKWTV